MKLDGDIVFGFTGAALVSRFDDPKPIPEFHKELWEMCCTDYKRIAIAAPRGHAKSTAVTLSYLLASLLFREKSYAIIVSDTEGQAIQFLGDLKTELLENEDLIELFGVSRLIKDSETKIVVEMSDGYQFRVETKGSEQKVRGLKWRNKRPDLIICHEEGTKIFADGKWQLNTEHPTAEKHTTSGYKITFEDGTEELVSKDHRYWIEGYGWVFATDLVEGMEVGGECLLMTKEEREIASITESGVLTTKKRLKLNKLHIVNEIKKRYISPIKHGLKKMQIGIKSTKLNITGRIRLSWIKLLQGMLRRMQDGRLRNVLREERKRNLRLLHGQIVDILNYSTSLQKSKSPVLVVEL